MTVTDTRPQPVGDPAPQPLDPPEQPTAPPAPEPQPDTEADIAAMEAAAVEAFEAAQRDTYPLSVHEAIAEVTRRVGHIGKGRQADRSVGGYRFRGIDDVLAALHPILGDVGLVILPGEVVREAWETRSTASGGTLNVARLLVRFALVGPDGSWLPGEAWGEAGDAGDKATQKAHSQAYKTFALQAFSIPTEASAADDPDATGPAAAPFTEQQRSRAAAAAKAAADAADLDALTAVRRHALGEDLLSVPVHGFGPVAMLGVLLDQRRAQLEQRPA